MSAAEDEVGTVHRCSFQIMRSKGLARETLKPFVPSASPQSKQTMIPLVERESVSKVQYISIKEGNHAENMTKRFQTARKGDYNYFYFSGFCVGKVLFV